MAAIQTETRSSVEVARRSGPPAPRAGRVRRPRTAGPARARAPRRPGGRRPPARRRRRRARRRSGRRCRARGGRLTETCWERAISGACAVSRCTIALAPSGGSGESQACCAATTRSAGRNASAPPPLPSPSIRHSVGRGQGDQVGEAAGDLAGETALLGLRGQRGAGGVDHGDQRQAELDGQPHPAPGLAQRSGSERVGLALPATVLPEEDAGGLPEPGQRDQQPGVRLALAGAVERDDVGGGVPQQPSYAGPVGAP